MATSNSALNLPKLIKTSSVRFIPCPFIAHDIQSSLATFSLPNDPCSLYTTYSSAIGSLGKFILSRQGLRIRKVLYVFDYIYLVTFIDIYYRSHPAISYCHLVFYTSKLLILDYNPMLLLLMMMIRMMMLII